MPRYLRTAFTAFTVFIALIAFAGALPAQGSDPRQTVTVGTASAPRGQRAYGVIDVPPGSDPGTTIHVAVINGAKPGPVVAFISGAHGTEYTSIVALTRIIERIDPQTLAGSVIVVPLVNVASFEQMVPHINPVDKKGMNGGYPGDPAGTQSLRAVALVADKVVKQADVIVDLHGGDLDEDLRPYSYWIRSGNLRKDADSRALALAFGLNMVIVRDVDVSNPASSQSLSGYAMSLGKTTLVAEAGHSGIVNKSETDALVNGLLGVLNSLKMVTGPTIPVPRVTWVGADQRVRADGGGMFYATATRGSRVEKGARVGWITDYVGRKVGDVLAPQAGVVTFIRGVPSLSKGATIVTVAQVYGATPPPYVKPSP
jgi:predicted deacylase